MGRIRACKASRVGYRLTRPPRSQSQQLVDFASIVLYGSVPAGCILIFVCSPRFLLLAISASARYNISTRGLALYAMRYSSSWLRISTAHAWGISIPPSKHILLARHLDKLQVSKVEALGISHPSFSVTACAPLFWRTTLITINLARRP